MGAEIGPDVDALVDGDRLADGHAAQGDHAVHMAVDGHHAVRHIEVFDEEFLAELLGGIALYVIGACGITDVHRVPPV